MASRTRERAGRGAQAARRRRACPTPHACGMALASHDSSSQIHTASITGGIPSKQTRSEAREDGGGGFGQREIARKAN